MEATIATAAAVVFFGILATPLILRSGAPLLLLFLGLGMLLGENGPVGIVFDDFELAYQLGSIALAVILFSGGMETQMPDVRRALAPALALATVGVCMTAGILGGLASLILGIPIATALLLGAVCGSTDAAATFLLLQQNRIGLAGRTRPTILLESGLNDPIAIFLTLVLISVVDGGPHGLGLGTVAIFAKEMGVGAAAGIAGGLGLAYLVNRVPLLPGLFPVLVLMGGLMLFGATAGLGGSGFLAVFLCGVMVSDRATRALPNIVDFLAGMAWISQIGLFLMLGLLVTPATLPRDFGAGIAAAILLIFVARPIAVITCLAPLGFPFRQQLYIGWMGLRGAVPIFLATLPVISPGPVDVDFFNEVFIVVIVSLFVQGWTVAPAARLLKVQTPEETERTENPEVEKV